MIVTTSLLDRNVISDDGRCLIFLMLNILIFCMIVTTGFFGRYRSRLLVDLLLCLICLDLSAWFFGSYFAIFDAFLPGILPLYSYLSPTITISHCGCWLLSKFPIYNAKCLCYFQFLATGFNGRTPYPLTWAC